MKHWSNERRLSSFTSFFLVLPNTSIILNWFMGGIEEGTWKYVFYRQLELEFVVQWHDIVFHITEQEQKSIEWGNHGLQILSTVRMKSAVGSLMIIVVSRLLFWFAILWSGVRTNVEYTWITWRFRVISVTFEPWNETGRMTVRPFNPRISRISLALVKSMVWGNLIQIHP